MTNFELSMKHIWMNAKTLEGISWGLMGYYYALFDYGVTKAEDEDVQTTVEFLLDIVSILREQGEEAMFQYEPGDRVLTSYGIGVIDTIDEEHQGVFVAHDEMIYGGMNPKNRFDNVVWYSFHELRPPLGSNN